MQPSMMDPGDTVRKRADSLVHPHPVIPVASALCPSPTCC
jgi:hypothetical protein